MDAGGVQLVSTFETPNNCPASWAYSTDLSISQFPNPCILCRRVKAPQAEHAKL
jgi:hypothetical protein